LTKLPSLPYREVIKALQQDGWQFVRQRGSHIRLRKDLPGKTLKLTVPAHNPIRRSTLKHILSSIEMDVDYFIKLLS
jgi:predicted RNA binding protein YcfA (HicA-like mRNA interferase family)